MDIDLLTMSISALAVAISVYATAPVRMKKFNPPERKPRNQFLPKVRKLIENVDELERIAKSL